MDRRERAHLAYLHSMPEVGQQSLRLIKDKMGAFEPVFKASSRALYSLGLPNRTVLSILEHRHGNISAYFDELERKEIKICTIEEADYPAMLAEIFDPPYLFYYDGNIDLASRFCLAMVGSRAASYYGKKQAHTLAGQLADQGVVVVSGMARGIDTQAHRGALDAAGDTIAVLGSGLDIIYPAENNELYHTLRKKGLVISDFAPGTPPLAGNFPARNRIISGLSYGVLVVEARRKSGALITVDFALEQGREVFSIPGQLDSKNSEGTNQLLKDGAIFVTEYRDILQEYPQYFTAVKPSFAEQPSLFELDNNEVDVLKCMSHEPIHLDELVAKSTVSMGILSELSLIHISEPTRPY